LETIDVYTGVRSVLKEFDYVIEAPNWTRDGQYLLCNSRGRIYKYKLATGKTSEMNTGFAIDCNNDHVLSPDGRWVVYLAYDKADVSPGDHPPNKNVELRLVPDAGDESKTIARLFDGQGTINVNSWSPDSRTLAFVSYRLKESNPSS
jgi:TolB protein